eukprot:1153929-Amphidinium_carterae.1
MLATPTGMDISTRASCNDSTKLFSTQAKRRAWISSHGPMGLGAEAPTEGALAPRCAKLRKQSERVLAHNASKGSCH